MVPSAAKQEEILAKISRVYPRTEPVDLDRIDIEAVIDSFLTVSVNRESSPGCPLGVLYSTNEELIQQCRGFVVRCVKERLTLLKEIDPDIVANLTAEEKVMAGLCDPIREFVKNEPHGREKMAQGRFRLIMSVSIIDQLVERVLFHRQNATEVACWVNIPSKGGASMNLDSDVNHMAQEFFNQGSLASVDVSGFDWSVKDWELKLDARARVRLAIDPKPSWIRAVFNRVECLSHAVFSFSDGKMVAQVTKGIQKSGSYNTTPTNSRIKVCLGWLAGSEYAVATGDDGVESYVEQAPDTYALLGHPLKTYYKCTEYVPFCSSEIRSDGSWVPATWSKTFYRFLYQSKLDSSYWQQLCHVLRHSPHLGRIRKWMREYSRAGFADSEAIGEILLQEDAYKEEVPAAEEEASSSPCQSN